MRLRLLPARLPGGPDRCHAAHLSAHARAPSAAPAATDSARLMSAPQKGPYSRVYHSLMDDPDFAGVYESDRLFAMWTRMLMAADAFWPNSAPMPHKSPALSSLIEKGLVIPLRGNRYTIKGLSAERERRSASARNAAAVRWQSDRNALAMPRRDEKRIEEGFANANAMRPHAAGVNGSSKSGLHDGRHADCAVCAPLRPQTSK